MGNIRRVKRRMSHRILRDKIPSKIAMADAHIEVNGCQVFLGHPNSDTALVSAKGFKEMLTKTIMRARCPNLNDLYSAHLDVLEKIERGEVIWN